MTWLDHHYGPRVHILDSKPTNTWLTQLCSPSTKQPRLNILVELLYQQLLIEVLNQSFPYKNIVLPTRMASQHPDAGLLSSQILDAQTRVIVVNLARAGTWPSHLCYSLLNDILNPDLVRQDHIFASRKANSFNQVTGTEFGAHKIGGDQDQAYVMFPDPMGATGHTLAAAIEYYKKMIEGKAKRYLAMHLIVTPEYLKNVLTSHDDVEIFALRVDRGLSDQKVLQSPPGLFWDQEKGLNDHDYIVPGAGGLGELLNNSFV